MAEEEEEEEEEGERHAKEYLRLKQQSEYIIQGLLNIGFRQSPYRLP